MPGVRIWFLTHIAISDAIYEEKVVGTMCTIIGNFPATDIEEYMVPESHPLVQKYLGLQEQT